MIDEQVGLGDMPVQRGTQRGESVLVKTEQQRLSRGCRPDFVEKDLQRFVGDDVKTEGRLAHLRHARAPGRGVFGAVVRMEGEAHFQLVDRFRCQAPDENLMEPAKRPVVALEARDTLVDGETEARSPGDRCDAGDRREIAIGAIVVRVHGVGWDLNQASNFCRRCW